MFCPKCGNDMPDTAKFCSKCGYEFEKMVTEKKKGLSPKARKVVIAVIGCCICLPVLIYFAFFPYPKSDWDYDCYFANGKFCASIDSYVGDENASEIVIPVTVKRGWISYDVKQVGTRAFAGCSKEIDDLHV